MTATVRAVAAVVAASVLLTGCSDTGKPRSRHTADRLAAATVAVKEVCARERLRCSVRRFQGDGVVPPAIFGEAEDGGVVAPFIYATPNSHSDATNEILNRLAFKLLPQYCHSRAWDCWDAGGVVEDSGVKIYEWNTWPVRSRSPGLLRNREAAAAKISLAGP